MLAVPVVEAVNVLLQVATPAVVPAAKVQVVNVPVTPLTLKVTVPVGALTGEVESVTVAVQVDPSLMTIVDGAQDTVVVVLCFA